MSRNLSHAMLACPPYWNTVSLYPTLVDHCTISHGTGRVVGTVSYTYAYFHTLGYNIRRLEIPGYFYSEILKPSGKDIRVMVPGG